MSLRLRIAAVIRPQYYSAASSTSKVMWKDIDGIINKVCDACTQAITDNPHKSPIEAIADLKRKEQSK